MTPGYQLTLTDRLFRSIFHNVLFEHGELLCVLPLAVHLGLEHLPDTKGYLGLLFKTFTPTQTL